MQLNLLSGLHHDVTYNIGKHISQFCLSSFYVEQTDSVSSADRQRIQLTQVTTQLLSTVHCEPCQWLWHASHAANLQYTTTISFSHQSIINNDDPCKTFN